MLRELERRLRAVERAVSGGQDICYEQDDGGVVNYLGERMTREQAEARARAAGSTLIVLYESDRYL